MWVQRHFNRWIAVLISVLFSISALAKGQLQAGPIMVQIGAGAKASRLRLSNTGDAQLSAQVRIFHWQQVDGEDQLTPSDAVVASPPIVQLAPGAEQIVRIVRLGPPAIEKDHNFRLVVDELPAPINDNNTKVSVRMRYVLPLFVRATDARPAKLSCRIDGSLKALECVNSGGRAAQLGATQLIDSFGWELPLSAGLLGYVLPGSRRIWTLPEDSHLPVADSTHPMRLETLLNGQPSTIPLQ
ncbi:fimbrial biogenesis chaperone [Microbulbifer elongatus]|uniref:fimbrial biogenesis chaperone n=2 Tax=Microbulbifer elongatus TaxID=86173 RepID=UPI001E2F3569|nr:fimbria/pilus periplasmic chaperone [Microbulbifer elongatus]